MDREQEALEASLAAFRRRTESWRRAKADLESAVGDHVSRWAQGAWRTDYDRYYDLAAENPVGFEERHPGLAAKVAAYEAESARFARRRDEMLRAVFDAKVSALEALGAHVGGVAAAEIARHPAGLMAEVVERGRAAASRLRARELDGVEVARFAYDGVGPMSTAFLRAVAEARGIPARGNKLHGWFNRVTEGLRQPVYGTVQATRGAVKRYREGGGWRPVDFGAEAEVAGEDGRDGDAVVMRWPFQIGADHLVEEFRAMEANGVSVVAASVRDPWFRRSVGLEVAPDFVALDDAELGGERDYAVWARSPRRWGIEAELERRREQASSLAP